MFVPCDKERHSPAIKRPLLINHVLSGLSNVKSWRTSYRERNSLLFNNDMVRFLMRRVAMNVGDTNSIASCTCVRAEWKLLFSGLTRLDYIDCTFFVKTFDGAFVRAFVYY